MIVGRLENAMRYAAAHPGLAPALDWLRGPEAAEMTESRRELDGTRIYAMQMQVTGTGRGAAKLEAHRNYIDIHCTLEGCDEIGWRPLRECGDIEQAYSEESDCELLGEAPTSWLALEPGSFAIFFPEDAHAPVCGDGPVRKIVMKIAVEW